MNHTITLPELVKLLADATNCSETTAQQFVTELFATVSDALANGKNVKIKNIGTFALDNLKPGEVKYLPDAELAEAVNHPFAFFEPVELDDELTEEELASAETTTAAETGQESQAETDESADSPETDTPLPPDTEDDSETPGLTPAEPISPPKEIDSPEPDQPIEESEKEEINEPQTTSKRRLNPWLMFAMGLLTGVVVGYLLPAIKEGVSSLWMTPYEFVEPNQPLLPAQDESTSPDIDERGNIRDSSENNSVKDTIIKATPTVTEENIGAKPTAVTDTIGRNRFLTTMSRKYYGRYEFWVYIYEENASRLGNPDKIAPGTIVNIPPANKYGINPDDPQSLRKAIIKAEEIYAPYQK